MRHVLYRLPIIIIIIILLAFSMLRVLTLAQELPFLEISLDPQMEYAVAGQPFTYTVVVTNTGPAPTEDIIIFVQTPAGTTFIRTGDTPNWAASGLASGETGNVLWTPREPVAPGDSATFELVVNVLPEMVHQQLVSNQYGFALVGSSDVNASDRVVAVEVLAAPPTPTPLPTATPTTVPTPTFTTVPAPTAITKPTSTTSAVAPPPATSAPVSERENGSLLSAPWLVVTVIVLGGAGLLVLGLIWYLKKQRS
jgi:uncharacterized repeat protein (TIGR01451 family)